MPSAYVDIYNATSASWIRLPEGLGQARAYLAAAAMSSGLVIFAGGLTGEEYRTSKSQQACVYECSRALVCALCLWLEED